MPPKGRLSVADDKYGDNRRRSSNANGKAVPHMPMPKEVSTTTDAASPTGTEKAVNFPQKGEDAAELYKMERFTLQFMNKDTELRYTNFCYIHSGFYGGKLWHVVSTAIFVMYFILYHPLGIHGGHHLLTDSRYILTDINMVSETATFICLFIPKLFPYREQLLLVSFVTHWPAIVIMMLLGKDPEPVTYSYTLGCYVLCCFVTQVRFSRLFPFLVFTPLLTLTLVVTTQVGYFDDHSLTELAFWQCVFFPLILLRSFEVGNRKNFESMERNESRIEDIGDKIGMVQSMVAHFFPPTPTVDLLVKPMEEAPTADGSTREKDTIEMEKKQAWASHRLMSARYTGAAMIVTDLKGFTQWSASCGQDTSIVIQLLTNMFLGIDRVMPMYNVEKIATVGDAFIGVIFNDDEGSPQKIGLRAVNAIQFGCDIVNLASSSATGLPHSLEMRIGVDVGDFVGGFIGTAPPRFDCFGPDFENVKMLESSGTPSFVHASNAAAAAAERWESRHDPKALAEMKTTEDAVAKFVKRSALYRTTERGVLCPSWEWQPPTATNYDQDEEDPNAALIPRDDIDDDFMGNDSNDAQRYQEMINEKALDICEALVTLSNGEAQPAGTPQSPASPSNSLRVTSGNEDDEVDYSHDGDDEVTEADDLIAEQDGDDFDFHVLFLEFNNKTVERRFRASMLVSGQLTSAFGILALLQYSLVFTHALNGCLNSVHNRLVLAGCILFTTIWAGYVQRFGVKSVFGVVLIVSCSIITFIIGEFQSADCGHRGEVINMSNIITGYYVSASIVTQFTLNFTLIHRLIMMWVFSAFGLIMVAVRLAVIGDDGAIKYDENWFFYPAIALAFSGVSYFVDFSRRSSFGADRKLRKLLSSAKGKHAETASQAMDVMLPSFVCDALLNLSKKDTSSSGSNSNDIDGDDSSSSPLTSKGSSRGSNSTRDRQSRGGESSQHVFDLEALTDGMLWEYPNVVVMFVSFKPIEGIATEGTELSYDFDEINRGIVKIEQIVAKYQVQKVKSIGNTFLAVTGIDERYGEPFKRTFSAALEIKEHLESIAHFTIGINSGACFGAVIGVKGLCFDIFGDTVNTASRMCSTAQQGTIQLSDTVRMAALVANEMPKGTNSESIDTPVVVKGKGKMNVYRLVQSSSPAPGSPAFGSPTSSMSMSLSNKM